MNITRETDLKGTEPCTWRHFPSLYIIQTWISNIERQHMNLHKNIIFTLYYNIYSNILWWIYLNELPRNYIQPYQEIRRILDNLKSDCLSSKIISNIILFVIQPSKMWQYFANLVYIIFFILFITLLYFHITVVVKYSSGALINFRVNPK